MKNVECARECLRVNKKEMTLREICDWVEENFKENTRGRRTYSQTLKTDIYYYCSQSKSYKEIEDIFYKIQTEEGVKFGLNEWKQFYTNPYDEIEDLETQRKYFEGENKK